MARLVPNILTLKKLLKNFFLFFLVGTLYCWRGQCSWCGLSCCNCRQYES